MDIKNLVLSFIRIILGCTFLLSAALKLVSIENFELYVYSFGFFSFVLVSFLTRFLILCEFLIGIALIFRIFYKQTWWAAIAMLCGFSLFLVYAAMFRGDENCHCFGDVIELNPIPSILKNILLTGLLLFVKQQKELHHPIKPYVITISILSALFIAFLGVPPHVLYSKIFSDSEERFNPTAFATTMTTEPYNAIIDSTHNEIIGFVSASCSHCKAGNKIMQAIFEQNDLDISAFKNIIWASSDSSLNVFKDTTNTQNYSYTKMPPNMLIDINYGHFPTYVFFEKGHFKKAINYKEINEKEIVEFLQK
ncbi:MAG: DoxX family protein [Bacteroidales bacterium]|nr:DoxX family protein [Bacteroidales bacterium]